jgi:hypothetical protein
MHGVAGAIPLIASADDAASNVDGSSVADGGALNAPDAAFAADGGYRRQRCQF